MSHTTEELLLAAEVRKIAVTMMRRAMPEGLTDAEELAWMRANPAKNWVKPAIEDLEFIADLMLRP
jgi:hypothetical protein